jgi:GNAT superfamily N-acetyltransferase
LDGDAYTLLVDDSPDPAELALLEDRVAAAAIEAAGAGEDRAFAVFVRNEADEIVAGISGMTWGGFCELHALWVDEPLRGRGLARALMAKAESLARSRGCALVEFFA